MRWLFLAVALLLSTPAFAGSWAISLQIDPDKTNVGTFSATFTDTDTTVFTFSARGAADGPGSQAFTNAAIAARNAWQAVKSRETTGITATVNKFTAAGETATGALAQ